MWRAVHTSPETRHIKARSGVSQIEVPLSLILPQRWNSVVRWLWFMCISIANAPPPWASSTSPAFSAETLGVLIPAGRTSSESPCRREVVKQKEERDTLFRCCFVLLQEAKRQTSRQQKRQVTERALPTRREAIAPVTRGCGGLQAPFPPLDFYCLTRRCGSSKALVHWARHPAAREAVQTALCLVSGAAVKQKSLAEFRRAPAMPAEGPGTPGAQPLGTRGMWLKQCGSWAAVLQHLYKKKKSSWQTPKLPKMCLHWSVHWFTSHLKCLVRLSMWNVKGYLQKV